jgi:asparagine synthase (glutamine-hydrolysing)
MAARGPDAVGYWEDSNARLRLGHRRLAILDLDHRADQPMRSEDGRYTIVFNGEIYNFRQLRASLEIEGFNFRTESDTEVLLALFVRDGPRMLRMLRGMFAIAIWDRDERKLFLARDPYGIKPLYIGKFRGGFAFASQIKALLACGHVSREPDVIGQASFWLLGSVFEPRTWFRDIEPVGAGTWMLVNEAGGIDKQVWCDIGDFWRKPGTHALEDVSDAVRTAVRSSVAAHLVSDVPVGIFLSGGVDSGSIAALMAELQGNVLAVTLGFEEFSERSEDERPAAEELAARYGMAHHVRTVRFQEFESDLACILKAMDQPSVDGVNTWYASKAISELGMKVAISGIGGDELFQGYGSFRQLPRLKRAWTVLGALPFAQRLARNFGERRARTTANSRWRTLPHALESIQAMWLLRRGLFGIDDLPRLMGKELAAELDGFDPVSLIHTAAGWVPSEPRLAVGQLESTCYLRSQLLRDSDWASMDHSLELRTPLVDHWLLRDLSPVLAQFSKFPRKTLLAHVPKVPLPNKLVRRPKTGFGIPVRAWLRRLGKADSSAGPSRTWAREVASEVYRGD